MIYLIFLSWMFSAYLIYKLFNEESSNLYRSVMTIIVLIPLIGPLLFFFIHDMPPVQSIDKQDRMPRGGYTQQWDLEKKKLQKKIRDLQEEIDKDQNT